MPIAFREQPYAIDGQPNLRQSPFGRSLSEVVRAWPDRPKTDVRDPLQTQCRCSTRVLQILQSGGEPHCAPHQSPVTVTLALKAGITPEIRLIMVATELLRKHPVTTALRDR